MANEIIHQLSKGEIPLYCSTLPEFLNRASKQGTAKPSTLASHSHYTEPLKDQGLRGNSRRWSDADSEVKLVAINNILDQAIKQKMNLNEAALALSITQIESGFNPDAAAPTSSASGLGQFIDKTARAYGINANNRFDIKNNSKALVNLIKDILQSQRSSTAKEKDIFIRTYGHYHDGSILSEETKILAQTKIPPLLNLFKNYLASSDCLGRF